MDDEWESLLLRQEGAVTIAQLNAHGFSRGAIAAQLAAHRRQRPIPGIYVTFTGPLPILTRYWVALLHAGPGAVLSHTTAGTLWRLLVERRQVSVHVTIERPRNVRSRKGLVIHRSRLAVAPEGWPPCTGVARTAVDLCAGAKSPSDMAGILGRVAQQYPRALVDARDLAIARATMPRREEFLAVLDDVSGGVHSALEWRFLSTWSVPTGFRAVSVSAAWEERARTFTYAGTARRWSSTDASSTKTSTRRGGTCCVTTRRRAAKR